MKYPVSWVPIAALTLFLEACDLPKPCVATDVVRVSINEINYNIPVDIRPSFLGGTAKNLRYGEFRAIDGRWAYCQAPSDERVNVKSFSPWNIWELWKDYPELTNITFIWIEERSLTKARDSGSDWPTARLSGYEISYNKENAYVARYKDYKLDVVGHCSLRGDIIDRCRLSFSDDHGTLITIDLRGLHVDQWGKKLQAVKRFIRSFEVAQ